MTMNEFGAEIPTGVGGAKQPSASEYVAIVEGEGESWGAYVPDLPGLGVAAESEQEARRLIEEAIGFHIEGMRAEGLPVPPPSARAHGMGSTSPS
jgi:predicted RNase H-like HicB family nuclease